MSVCLGDRGITSPVCFFFGCSTSVLGVVVMYHSKWTSTVAMAREEHSIQALRPLRNGGLAIPTGELTRLVILLAEGEVSLSWMEEERDDNYWLWPQDNSNIRVYPTNFSLIVFPNKEDQPEPWRRYSQMGWTY